MNRGLPSAAWAVLLAGLAAAPARLCAQAPAWVNDPCGGIDCAAIVAGVGRADFLPEMRISSAVAYAQAVKNLSSSLAETISLNERTYYSDNRGQSLDSAIKDLAESPLGTSLMKIYGGSNSDTVSVTIQLRPLPDGEAKVYAQEYADAAARTLYVRLLMGRRTVEYLRAAGRPAAARACAARGEADLEKSLEGGFSLYPGRRIRMSSQDIRVGRRNEFTLWVQDDDSGLTWVEQWPAGGADLLQGGQLAAKYVFDRRLKEWALARRAGASD
ncbi:MAG: hypothetical protein NTY77_09945 [Elusimicrobia bacterium]|nr:hypothetical protein [Elusimicrobiota bacterium]